MSESLKRSASRVETPFGMCQFSEPDDQLPALPVSADPFQLHAGRIAVGPSRRRSEFQGAVGPRRQESLQRFRPGVMQFEACGPSAARTTVRIQMPGVHFGEIEFRHVCLLYAAAIEGDIGVSEICRRELGQDGVAFHPDDSCVSRDAEQVASDSATQIGYRRAGSKPAALYAATVSSVACSRDLAVKNIPDADVNLSRARRRNSACSTTSFALALPTRPRRLSTVRGSESSRDSAR